MQNEKQKDIISFNEVEEKEVDWLWKPYLVKGHLNIIQGEPGCGKTFLTTALASIVSVGGKLPFTNQNCKIGNVILQNGEDGIDDTIKPRLMFQGADCRKIYFVDEGETNFLKIQDRKRLEKIIIEVQPELIILDPIQRFVGDLNMNSMNDVRMALAPLNTLAKKYNCAIVIVMHMNKNTNAKAIHRNSGSGDFIGIARSALTIMHNPENKEEKLMIPIKANLVKDSNTLSYKITDNGLEWLEEKGVIDADVLLNDSPDTKIEYAKYFTLGCLAASAIGGTEMIEYATNIGNIKEKTFCIARSDLKKNLVIDSYQEDNKWYWTLLKNNPIPLNEKEQSGKMKGGNNNE